MDENSKGNLVSPDEMMKNAKQMMLEGREPSNRRDWSLIFNFIAYNIGMGLEESASLLLAKIYDAPLSEKEIRQIVEFQISQKENEKNRERERKIKKNKVKEAVNLAEIKTTEKYWDCECEKNFIHPKIQTECPICGAVAEEQPDSRVNEVLAQGLEL